MVEISKKYRIGVKRFGSGSVNWIGAVTLWMKITQQMLNVFIQTILSPICGSIILLLILSVAIGNDRLDMLGVPFIVFLAPGLLAMIILGSSFASSSSFLIINKVSGTIVDLLYSPISPGEATTAIILAAVTRGFLVAIVSLPIFYFLADIEIRNYYALIFYTFISSFILGAAGMIVGIIMSKFEGIAAVNGFLIVPLTMISGTFFTIDKLPEFLQLASKCNPFFFMISGFRYSFLEIEEFDGSIFVGVIYLTILAAGLWLGAYLLYKKGYKIKS